MSEERDTELNEEEDTRMEDSREEHWRDVDEDGKDKSNMCVLRGGVYTRETEELRKRKILVSVLHPKWGNIFFTCLKGDII